MSVKKDQKFYKMLHNQNNGVKLGSRKKLQGKLNKDHSNTKPSVVIDTDNTSENNLFKSTNFNNKSTNYVNFVT